MIVSMIRIYTNTDTCKFFGCQRVVSDALGQSIRLNTDFIGVFRTCLGSRWTV